MGKARETQGQACSNVQVEQLTVQHPPPVLFSITELPATSTAQPRAGNKEP